MRMTGKIPFTRFHFDVRFRKAIGEVISYNSTVYEMENETTWFDAIGHVPMFDIDTDNEGGCAKLHGVLKSLCIIWDLNGYLFKTDNGFHFVATNVVEDKSELLKMFAFLYPYVDDKAFAFGIINEEWHLRLSKKPNGKPITFVHDFLYGEPETLNSEAHFDLLNQLSKFSRLNIPLRKPKGKLIDTDFGFTTYPLWK